MPTEKVKQPIENVTLNKRWNWSGYIKLAVSASWAHEVIVQSVRASERNSVIVGSNLSLKATFHCYFRESVSFDYHIYQLIPQHSTDYLQKILIKINLETEKQPNSNIALNKGLNWSTCTKLTVNASWTLGVMGQCVSASERNSVGVGSNLTQDNFLELIQRIFQWWIPYIGDHSATQIW